MAPAWNPAGADALAAQLDGARMMRVLAECTARVRLSGTPEELESFHGLERAMREAGFSTELILHDAYISLPGRCSVQVGGRELRAITHSMSTPTPGLTAPLVPAGIGDRAAFAAGDFRGCIALVEGIATEEVSVVAHRAGVAGLLHISPTEELYEMCISPVWGSPSLETRGNIPPLPVATIPHAEGQALRARLEGGEALEATLVTEVDTRWRKTPILVAELGAPGGAPDAPFVMLSGHHDSWHYGAMDNGTANVGMLESARLLASCRDSWRRGLRVCFWSGHSHGRYSGSAWYADEHFLELDRRCAAHVNIDSTGGAGATLLDRSGVIDELKAVAAEAVKAVSGQTHKGNRHGRVADQSFWGVGLPSMFGSVSHHPPGPAPRLGWWWHTPQDLIAHIDPANLVRDTSLLLRVLHRLLTSPVLPLDETATLASLAAELDAVMPRIGARLDLAAVRAAVTALSARLAALPGAPAAPEAINRVLMRLSRLLVPLNYTRGDRFVHDEALELPPWPALQPLRTLAGLAPDSPDSPFAVVAARRARNRLAYALAEADAALDAVLPPSPTRTPA